MTDKRYKVLLAGKSWVSTATHIKGFDQFSTVTFHLGAEPLVEALKDSAFDLRYMPAHEAQRDFPQTPEAIAAYDAVILSDIGSNTLLLHPDTWIHSRRTPNRLRSLKAYVENGGGLAHGRRLLQFPGHQRRRAVSRHAGRGDTCRSTSCPMTIASKRPRASRRQSSRTAHPILEGFHGDWPALLGFNEVKPKRSAAILATVSADYGEQPLLVTGSFGKGRTLAWTSDIGPHWLPPEFVAWPGYARLWRRRSSGSLARARPGRRAMIHVVGNAAVDTVIRLDRFPRPGETVVARGVADDLGGKGANQAVVFARCGQKVRLVAALGADAVGERIRENLAAERASKSMACGPGQANRPLCYLCRPPGRKYDRQRHRCGSRVRPLAPTDLDRWIVPGDWVVLQGNLRARRHPRLPSSCQGKEAIRRLIHRRPTPHRLRLESSRSCCLNRSEAMELGGRDDPLEAARVCEAGAPGRALTLGAEGAALVSASETLRVGAPQVDAVNTVGAGDVFCGTLVAGRAEGLDWVDALRAASQAAAICVARVGVLSSFPTRDEMANILPRRFLTGH